MTINNPTVEDLKDVWCFNEHNTGPVPDEYPLGAIIIGWEHFEPGSGTPHLHCYFELAQTRVRRFTVSEWFRRAWVSPRYGSVKQAYEYCRKDGCYRERGVWSFEKMQEGALDKWTWVIEHIQAHDTWSGVCTDSDLAGLVANRMAWALQVFLARPRVIRPLDMTVAGRRWQKRFHVFLTQTSPDDRHVTYVSEPRGNTGKTRFCQFCCAKDGGPRSPATLFGLGTTL